MLNTDESGNQQRKQSNRAEAERDARRVAVMASRSARGREEIYLLVNLFINKISTETREVR